MVPLLPIYFRRPKFPRGFVSFFFPTAKLTWGGGEISVPRRSPFLHFFILLAKLWERKTSLSCAKIPSRCHSRLDDIANVFFGLKKEIETFLPKTSMGKWMDKPTKDTTCSRKKTTSNEQEKHKTTFISPKILFHKCHFDSSFSASCLEFVC